jgi:hypothetical protein
MQLGFGYLSLEVSVVDVSIRVVQYCFGASPYLY